VWTAISKSLNVILPGLDDDYVDWMQKWNENLISMGIISIPLFLIYFIWWDRNLCIFQELHNPPEVLEALIEKLILEFKIKGKIHNITYHTLSGIRNSMGLLRWG
jgi:hypothetical protein